MENNDNPNHPRKTYKITIAILLSVVAAVIFFALSTVRLGAQGLYYDETFQAVSSFAYVGQKPLDFAKLTIRGIPIMNMSYVGAIKTAVYGLYLRISGNSFSVVSWRLVGIFFVCLGILVFGIVLRKRFSFIALAIFFLLLITDITILLTTRFDWGPVALALFLRLLIIAIWIDGELSENLRESNSFWIVALLGISLFEKLSAIFLIVPVALMILLNSRRRNIRHMTTSIFGGIVGSLPLILANLYSSYRNGGLISLQAETVYDPHEYSFLGFLQHLGDSLALGAGTNAQGFILGVGLPIFNTLETLLLSLILFAVIFIIYSRLRSTLFRMSGIMLLCYVSVILGTYLLPAPTWIHHWVIATPFQYAAITLFLFGWMQDQQLKKNTFVKYAITVLLSLFFMARLVGLVSVEQALAHGDSSIRWDPSLTQMSELAAKKSKEAVFVAGDWGIANQMICFVNGRPGIIFTIDSEPGNIHRIVRAIQDARTSELYIVFTEPPYFVSHDMQNLLVHQIEESLLPQWKAQPVESEIKSLKSVSVYKFVKLQKRAN